MPPLKRPCANTHIQLPAQTALLAAEIPVLVIGAGPAGIGAALGAAKAGADVLITERYGFPGGSATVALVMPLMSAHTQQSRFRKSGSNVLFPTDHGDGKRVIAGVLLELVNKLILAGGAIPPSYETGYVVPFDPEIFKHTVLSMFDEAGISILLHAYATNYIREDNHSLVIFQSKSGPLAIRASCVIDCTGDGDVAAYAGAPFHLGRDHDGLTQPMTLYFRMVGFERPAFLDYVKNHPEQWYGVFGLWDLIEQATRDGKLNLPREDLLMFASPHDNEVNVNSTRVTEVNSTDVFDLTYAEYESRKQVHEVSEFLKNYVPGFNNSYMAQSGVQIGIRESRRILGDYILTGEDILEARKFHDVIARCAYALDIHNPRGKGTRIERLPEGESYDIPLRCLMPQNCERLLTAGRCISGTHEAHSSYRVMPAAIATGQAAGVCAGLAALQNTIPRNVDIKEIQNELRRQNADLGW